MPLLAALLLLSPSGSPDPAKIEAYTKFQEFHFEIRMEPQQREQYQQFLAADYKAGRLSESIDQADQAVASWTKGDVLTILGSHSSMKQTDEIEESAEGILNNGTIHGSGIAAQTRKEARDGCASSQFLLKQVAAYRKPLRGDGNIHTSLFQKELDATYEWSAMRMVFAAGRKVWDGSPANRDEVQKALLKHYDSLSPAKQETFRGFLTQSVNDWLVWRLGDYGFIKRMSAYQRKEAVARWAHEVVPFVPGLRGAADQRTQELKDFAASMPQEEVKAEFERQLRFNQQFSAFMAKRQAESNGLQQTVAQMRSSMLDFHVANLNIAENIGSTGFVWKITA